MMPFRFIFQLSCTKMVYHRYSLQQLIVSFALMTAVAVFFRATLRTLEEMINQLGRFGYVWYSRGGGGGGCNIVCSYPRWGGCRLRRQYLFCARSGDVIIFYLPRRINVLVSKSIGTLLL